MNIFRCGRSLYINVNLGAFDDYENIYVCRSNFCGVGVLRIEFDRAGNNYVDDVFNLSIVIAVCFVEEPESRAGTPSERGNLKSHGINGFAAYLVAYLNVRLGRVGKSVVLVGNGSSVFAVVYSGKVGCACVFNNSSYEGKRAFFRGFGNLNA